VDFRQRLLATLRAAEPVLSVPGVLVIGSELPNLWQPGVASSLVVSEALDVGVPSHAHGQVEARLSEMSLFAPSDDEPSVWLPQADGLLELNFVGLPEPGTPLSELYPVEGERMSMLVFGTLGLLRPGRVLEIDGMRIPMPQRAGGMLEKLVSERSGLKGDRDLLVVLGILMHADEDDLEQLTEAYASLPDELRHSVRSNATVLSLLQPVAGMPDPLGQRERVHDLLCRLEAAEAQPSELT